MLVRNNPGGEGCGGGGGGAEKTTGECLFTMTPLPLLLHTLGLVRLQRGDGRHKSPLRGLHLGVAAQVESESKN